MQYYYDTDDSGCAANYVCDGADACVECTENADCTGANSVCDTGSNTCVECAADSDCANNFECAAGNTCSSTCSDADDSGCAAGFACDGANNCNVLQTLIVLELMDQWCM
ncbi:hypothetical protein PPERSA_02707 [Pseudocohnilembus persalinus]|uniref:Uncharacterized protein n=1 Tax=Pseudocohnilembus persalinus TaxID=266149 RepID=A0A0V0R5T9_PSEPJ|nr:hypothetical protein PPERSA_02707 [Pseudocohnilembus persalinus]|eukprot:KRX09835.1 hypothetical protein PPERSA_02707 [Pseudocohnilembus persalinus]